MTAAPKFAVVEYGACEFLICDSPSNSSLPLYTKEFIQHNVTDVVRVCEPSYEADNLRDSGIELHDWPFADGSAAPPPTVLAAFLNLVDRRAREAKLSSEGRNVATICVHCVAGLGRAPLLVALALIEMGMRQLEAVEFVRSKRRGAFTTRQLSYINSYKSRGCLRRWAPGGQGLNRSPSPSAFVAKAGGAASSFRSSFVRIFNRSFSGGSSSRSGNSNSSQQPKMNAVVAN